MLKRPSPVADSPQNFGRKFSPAAVAWFILALGSLAVWRCGDASAVDLELASFKESKRIDDSTLVVVQGSPRTTLSPADLEKEIVVVFNHPMVPLGALPERVAPVFKIEPAHPGRFRWYGSRVVAFVPEKAYLAGTKYTVTVPPDRKAINGMSLGQPFRFQFDTPPLALVSSSPSPRAPIRYKQNFRLYFNYPVALETIRGKVKMTAGGRSVAFRAAYPERNLPAGATRTETGRREARRQVRLFPAAPLPRDTEVKIIIPGDLQAEGESGAAARAKELVYKTYGPLKVSLKNEAKFFQNLWDLRFSFNNPVAIKELKRKVRITPAARFVSFRQGHATEFPLNAWAIKPSTKYTVSLAADTRDRFGNRIVGTRSFSFTTPRYRRNYFSAHGVSVIEARKKQRVPVHVTGMAELQGAAGRVRIEDIKQVFVEGQYGAGVLNQLKLNDPQPIRWKTGLTANKRGRLGYDLAPFFKGKPGWLALRWNSPVENQKGESEPAAYTRIIQSTDLGLAVKRGSTGSHVWVHSFSTGKPRADLKVGAYEGDDRLGTCETDANGYCSVPHEKREKNNFYYTAAAGGDKDAAFVTARHHSVSMWSVSHRFDTDAALPLLRGQVLFDRKLYRPGDRVRIKAFLALQKDGELDTDPGTVTARLSNPRGEEMLSKTLRPDDEGGIHFDWEVPDQTPLGHYTVALSSNRFKKDSHRNRVNDTFQVEEFRPVGFTVSSKGLRRARVGETLEIAVSGRYLFGAPMADAPVNTSANRRPRNLEFPRFAGYWFGDNDYGLSWDTVASFQILSGGQGKLDGDGRYSLNLKLPPFPIKSAGADKDLHRPYDLAFEARVRDRDDKQVANQKTVTVYPGTVLPGLRAKRAFQDYKKRFEFDLVGVNRDGRGAPATPATVVVERRDWKSIQTKGPGGSIQRKNTLIRTEILRENVEISGEPAPFEVEVEKPGSYAFILRTADGAYSRQVFYAFGGGFIGWDFPGDDSIQILPDRREYAPGDTARILIQSPFRRSTAVVTVEREKVFWQKTVRLEGNGEPIEIPIKPEYIPNMYVSVMLVRPRVKMPDRTPPADHKRWIVEDIGRPQFKMGVTRLTVSTDQKRLPLEVKTDRQSYGPGDTVNIDVKTDPGARVALTVADRGVLDLIDYSYRDPIDIFYKDWAHGVALLENRRALIRQTTYANKGAAPGGKGEDDGRAGRGGFGKDKEDGARKDFRYTAHWSPELEADSAGRAKIEFKLPHNLTTFRVMAVAAKDGRYNRARREFQVKKSLVLRPVLPRFLRPGDELEIGAVLVNQTGRDDTFQVQMKSPLLHGAKLAGEITLQNGKSGEISFPVRLNGAAYKKLREKLVKAYGEKLAREPGAQSDEDQSDFVLKGARVTGTISAGAASGSEKDTVEFAFPVREHPPVEAFTIAGFTDDVAKEAIRLPERGKIQDGLGRVRIQFASTALVGMERALAFFRTNPYFCLEQRASAFLAGMTAGPLLAKFGATPPAKGDYDFHRVGDLFLKELTGFQNADGGFRGWRQWSGKSRPYLTAYAVFVLQAAAESNAHDGTDFEINEEAKSKAIKYLREFIRKPGKIERSYLLETLAMIHYVLARENKADDSLEEFLLENRDKISLRARGYLMLGRSLRLGGETAEEDRVLGELLEEVRSRMQVNTRRVSFKERSDGSYLRAYYSDGATMAVLLRSLIRLESRHPFIPLIVRHALRDARRTHWGDSHGVGQLAYALRLYRKVYEKDPPDFAAVAEIDGKQLAKGEFRDRDTSVHGLTVSLDRLYRLGRAGQTSPFHFTRKGKTGRLYYSAAFTYAPAPGPSRARDEGIEVRREILPLGESRGGLKAGAGDKDFPELRRGKMYLYRLTVVNPKPVYDALIRDALPANVEVVREKFATESGRYARFLREKRDAADWYRPRYEYRDDSVVVIQEYLSPGVHEYFYLGRALVRGKAGAPAARAFGMYEPEIFGRSAGGLQVVR